MKISHAEIEKLISKYNIVENYKKENINPSGIDLRVGEIYELDAGGAIRLNEVKSPYVKKGWILKEASDEAYIEEVSVLEEGKSIRIKKENYYLIRTIEKINLPKEKVELKGEKYFILAFVYGRSSLFRIGASLYNTLIDPGWSGKLTFGLKPFLDLEIEIGASIAQIAFEPVLGDIEFFYEDKGRYMGGKLFS